MMSRKKKELCERKFCGEGNTLHRDRSGSGEKKKAAAVGVSIEPLPCKRWNISDDTKTTSPCRRTGFFLFL